MFLQKLLPVTITDVAEYNYNKFKKYVEGRDFCALSYRIDTDAVIDGAKLKSDSVTFFPARVGYTRRCTRDNMLVIHFETVGLAGGRITTVYPKNETVFKLFSEITDVWAKKESGYQYRAQSILYGILYLLELEFGKGNTFPSLLESAVHIISKEFADTQLTVSRLARHLNVSEVYLRRLFAKHLGTSPKQHITAIRIDNAKALFKTTDCPVEEVSLLSGFSDPKNFAVAFKNSVGISPRAYKKKYSSYI